MRNGTDKPLRILFLSAEAAPLIKVGGLADFAGALPAQIRRMGHDVRLVLPLHPSLRPRVAGAKPVARPAVSARGSSMQAEVYRIEENGAPVYLVDGPPLRASDAIYHADAGRDAAKYVFFSLAALELARSLGWKPDLVHTNDWHTAAANLWLAGRRAAGPLLPRRALRPLGSQPAVFRTERRMGAGPVRIGGAGENPRRPCRDSDAAEVRPVCRASQLGVFHAPAARARRGGPDHHRQPLVREGDPHAGIRRRAGGIPASPSRTGSRASSTDWIRRYGIRRRMRAWLRISIRPRSESARGQQGRPAECVADWTPDPSMPLIGMVTRMNEQKGIDLALPALECWCGRGNQAVILGAGDPYLEQQCRAFAARHPGRAAAEVGYHDDLASLIYGGSDAFLVPSRYEPCGISQMIAMRYGSLPVVRAVGGLKDTVRDAARGRWNRADVRRCLTGGGGDGAGPSRRDFTPGRAAGARCSSAACAGISIGRVRRRPISPLPPRTRRVKHAFDPVLSGAIP